MVAVTRSLGNGVQTFDGVPHTHKFEPLTAYSITHSLHLNVHMTSVPFLYAGGAKWYLSVATSTASNGTTEEDQ